MTKIEITEVESGVRHCLICKVELTHRYNSLHIEYSRDGFSTTDFKYLCIDCSDALYGSLDKIYGSEYDD